MGPFIPLLVIGGFSVWFFTQISHLGRKDISDTDRIVWMIVLCTLNIFGALLYWFMAPGGPTGKHWDKAGRYRVRTEEELKEYFNTRDDKKGA